MKAQGAGPLHSGTPHSPTHLHRTVLSWSQAKEARLRTDVVIGLIPLSQQEKDAYQFYRLPLALGSVKCGVY